MSAVLLVTFDLTVYCVRSLNGLFLCITLFSLMFLRHGDHVRHYHIKKDNGQLYISDRHRFPTVPELINYHQHNSGGTLLSSR